MSPTLKSAGIRLVGLLSLCSIVSAAVGLPTDAQQELKLDSDFHEFNLNKGTATYRGNVVLTQGSLRIESDELVVHRQGDIIEKAVATGSPATFEQQPELDQAPVVARGQRIEYELEGQVQKVDIIDEAMLEQGGIVSRCERIEINVTESTVKGMGSCATERPARNSDSASASGS